MKKFLELCFICYTFIGIFIFMSVEVLIGIIAFDINIFLGLLSLGILIPLLVVGVDFAFNNNFIKKMIEEDE